ncbi:MAG: hypothetical protein IKT90_01465 [Clostridia bacterium]|nr:hypothetical protein [Clostridia bacterium]
MDLRNGRIMMAELWENPRARAILQQEFPQFARNPMMLRMGLRMPLSRVLEHARGRVPQEKVERALQRLQNL